MVMLLFRGCIFTQNRRIFWVERTHKDQVQVLIERPVCKCCLMEFVIVHHLHVLLGCHVVSCLVSVESQLQRLCISLGLPLVGLKPVLREIRSAAHFSGGSVGFSRDIGQVTCHLLSQFNHLISEWTSVYLRRVVGENSLVLRLFKMNSYMQKITVVLC